MGQVIFTVLSVAMDVVFQVLRYLALAGHLVLGKENPGNMSKRLEQFLARIIRIELNYWN